VFDGFVDHRDWLKREVCHFGLGRVHELVLEDEDVESQVFSEDHSNGADEVGAEL